MEISWGQALILGMIQGVAEFLPISSSGHLVLFERLLGLQAVPLTFDVLLHAGTLLAVIAYFWKDIWLTSRKTWLYIALANIPIFVFGFLLHPYVSILRESRVGVALNFLLTAFLLLIADILLTRQQKHEALLWRMFQDVQNWLKKVKRVEPEFIQLLMIGVFQVIAILPGVSRSGSTLTGGAVAGLDRKTAFRYAFLIGLPAIIGAVTLDTLNVWQENAWASVDMGATLFATVVAGVVGLVSLRVLEFVIDKSHLRHFAVYCVIVSLLSLLIV